MNPLAKLNSLIDSWIYETGKRPTDFLIGGESLRELKDELAKRKLSLSDVWEGNTFFTFENHFRVGVLNG